MSTDLETRLRSAFQAAEQLITVDDSMSEDELLRHPANLAHRRRALWALGSAAAVVIAVAGLAIGLRTDRSTPPSTSTTSVVPSPISSSAPIPIAKVGPQPKTCDVPLPRAWANAITAGRVPGFNQLRAVGTDGIVYVERTLGTTSELFMVEDPNTVRPVYIAPGGSRIGDVQVEGDWAVISLVSGGGQGSANGLVAMPIGMNEQDAVTIRQGAADDGTIVAPFVISHGIVYWFAGSNTGAGALHAYDLAKRKDKVIARGSMLFPFGVGGGVYWHRGDKLVTERAGHLPPGYVLTGNKQAYGALQQSGRNSLWAASGKLSWQLTMSDGGSPVTVVRPIDSDQLLSPHGLSGDFALYNDGTHIRALDWTTGADTTLPGTLIYADAATGGGVIALQTANGRLSVMRTSDLPTLHC